MDHTEIINLNDKAGKLPQPLRKCFLVIPLKKAKDIWNHLQCLAGEVFEVEALCTRHPMGPVGGWVQ